MFQTLKAHRSDTRVAKVAHSWQLCGYVHYPQFLWNVQRGRLWSLFFLMYDSLSFYPWEKHILWIWLLNLRKRKKNEWIHPESTCSLFSKKTDCHCDNRVLFCVSTASSVHFQTAWQVPISFFNFLYFLTTVASEFTRPKTNSSPLPKRTHEVPSFEGSQKGQNPIGIPWEQAFPAFLKAYSPIISRA